MVYFSKSEVQSLISLINILRKLISVGPASGRARWMFQMITCIRWKIVPTQSSMPAALSSLA